MWKPTAIAALALAAAGCAISQQQEVQMGQQYATQTNSQLPIVGDAAINQYLNSLGMQIASHTSRSDLQWHFYLVNSDVVNAFALPGGFIYVNRGIVEHADRMDELAGVIGHEIGHVVRRHSVKQMEQMQGANVGLALACTLTQVCQNQAAQAAIQVGGAAVFAKFSRQDENEADQEGVKNVINAGISPEGMVSFFQKLLSLEGSEPSGVSAWFADHPLTSDRIKDVENMISQYPPSQLRGLTTDTQAFHDFKARVAQLPPPPPQQQAQNP
jgi:predicted Zn-dependent protease